MSALFLRPLRFMVLVKIEPKGRRPSTSIIKLKGKLFPHSRDKRGTGGALRDERPVCVGLAELLTEPPQTESLLVLGRALLCLLGQH